MEFAPKQAIIESALGGILFIDIPVNYIIDSYAGKCSINQAFSFFSNCKNEYNRISFNTTHNNWLASSNGNLKTSIDDIMSPNLDGDTRNFVISNYDNNSKKVLGRTYR